jgi:hypothetical protein
VTVGAPAFRDGEPVCAPAAEMPSTIVTINVDNTGSRVEKLLPVSVCRI